MQGAVYSFRSALSLRSLTGLFENGVRRAEKGAECELRAGLLLSATNAQRLTVLCA